MEIGKPIENLEELEQKAEEIKDIEGSESEDFNFEQTLLTH